MSLTDLVRSSQAAYWRNTDPAKMPTGREFVSEQMANYLASTGRLTRFDAARVSSGMVTEGEKDRLFTQASYNADLQANTSARKYRLAVAAQGARARDWAQQYTEARRRYGTSNTTQDASSIGGPTSVADSGISGSSLSGSGLS